MKRVVISGLICMAILFELLTFACCGVKNARLQVVLTDYAAVLESNGLDGLRLSVYYIDPSILTRFPLTEERLLSFESVQRFDVDNAHRAAENDKCRGNDAGFKHFRAGCAAVLHF